MRSLRAQNLKPQKHHLLLIDALQKVADGRIKKLMVTMPPGSAKSEYVSRLFPPWFLSRKRNLRVIGTSNTAQLSEKMSRDAQRYAAEDPLGLGYKITRENVEHWYLSNGGEYRSAGVGGTITGFRADLAIIDDPIKGPEDAESPEQRDKQWSWYSAVLMSRLKPSASIILVLTRWHEDDIAGRLRVTEGDQWTVIDLPATARENDPLGRQPGELLWDGDPNYRYGDVLRARKAEAEQNGQMRFWNALYEQDPRPLDGGVFDTRKLVFLDQIPDCKRVVRGWDFAATEKVGTRDPDWTVGLKLGQMHDGRFVVLDVKRGRLNPDAALAELTSTAGRDGRGVRIAIPQDPGQAGKWQVSWFAKHLAGYAVSFAPISGNKGRRADPVASQIGAGNVCVVKASWNAAFVDELRSFPSGTKDDQVDALAQAFNTLVTAAGRVRAVNLPFLGR